MSPLAQVRQWCQEGRSDEAATLLAQFCREKLGVDCQRAALNPDGYSLNSLNGLLTLGEPYLGESELFFKFHQEEDESKGVAEYYHSKLLEEAGLPVDVPLAARHEPGEQILLYRVRREARMADVCRALEHGETTPWTAEEVLRLQTDLDRQVGAKYLETLHLATAAEAGAEALHQLFYHRLAEADGTVPGGRWRSYYLWQEFEFPGVTVPWSVLRNLTWRVNGRRYRRTLGELFAEAAEVLDPSRLPAECPAVLGHGDAHNANLWLEPGRLVYFDPAFAGAHLPALLAEIKATFHNIFAHADWLYHPADAETVLRGGARLNGDVLEVEHSWELNSLRSAFLQAKIEHVWRPLRRALPAGFAWERYVRLALFCCPTLVMNLRAGAGRHNPMTSLVGLSIAMMCGSEGKGGSDPVEDFIEALR